jgi:hypothetical protein
MDNEIHAQGLADSTVIILSAKHGQSPRDPNQLTRIDDTPILNGINAAWAVKHPGAAPRGRGQAKGAWASHESDAEGGREAGQARWPVREVAAQIKQRVAGEAIKDRIVSLSDPDARPIRKGKLGNPNEFGWVTQLAEVTENTKRGARGLILPASSVLGNPSENTLLPGTVAELIRIGIQPRDVALDGGFQAVPDQHRARRPGAQDGVHRWPPRTRLQVHPTPTPELQNRRRRTDQPSQTPLRIGPQPAQRRRGPTALD